MSTVTSSSSTLSLWHPRGEQALQVATLLRGAPMTLLFGDQGAGKTTLLMQGVLPLLRRRWADLRSDAWQGERSPTGAQPERRRGAWQRRREIALYIDTWTDAVRDALRMRVDASSRHPDTAAQPEWLLLFDGYEEHLRTSNSSTQAFDSWLMRHLGNAASRVHVLMSLDSGAEPQLLQRYDPRLVRLSNHYLRLLPVRGGMPGLTPETAASLEAPAPPVTALVASATPLPVAPVTVEPVTVAPVTVAPVTVAPVPPMAVATAPGGLAAHVAVDSAMPLHEAAAIDELAAAIPAMQAAPPGPLSDPAPALVRSALRMPPPPVQADPEPAEAAVPATPVSAIAVAATPALAPSLRAAVPELGPGPASEPMAHTLPLESMAHASSLDVPVPELPRAAPSRMRKPAPPVELRWSSPAAASVPDMGIPAAATTVASTITDAAAAPHPDTGPARSRGALLWALAITVLAAGLWWAYTERSSGNAAHAPAIAADAQPDSGAARSGLPAWQLWAGTEDGARSPLTDDLLQFVAPAAGLSMTAHVHSGGVAGLAALSGAGRLAIARQDALRAAHARPDQPPLQVVMPLYTEEIYLLVRADSPLRYVHQMRGRVINIGPGDGPRALTAQTLYRDLFGSSLPMTHSATLDRDAALVAMLGGDAIDVLVLVGAQPDTWLAGLPQQTLKQLRPLTVDPNEPATRRVLQTSGAGLLRAADHPGWLQADVPIVSVQSYLVTPESSDVKVALQVGDLARALCRALPGLQLSGHPKWTEVQPGRQIAVGWPYAPIAAGAIGACLAAADDSPKTAGR